MSDLIDPLPAPGEPADTPFDTALSERYLVYALSTITARSLPDLRDGLKPVHRRLLWAMRLLKLDPASAYKKSARVVGDVIGKYHPHGDQSVYDAMVRLAQDFALRYPLVDGQGNFGNVDGDNAAAYRYTEARLTASAISLMAGLDDGTVEYKPTYNGEDEEPEIFPGLFPNLLANGASGIAVGMATSIPPHNVAEIIDAATLLIEQPNTDVAALLEHVKGPDLATGGQIIDSAAVIAEAYATGRGAFRVRSRWQVEDQGRGTWVAVVTEIPYQVQKGKLIEAIAAIINDKKLPILADVRDESDEAIRIVIEPRTRAVDADVLMESLFRLTELEVRISLNMNVLDADRTLQRNPGFKRWVDGDQPFGMAIGEIPGEEAAERGAGNHDLFIRLVQPMHDGVQLGHHIFAVIRKVDADNFRHPSESRQLQHLRAGSVEGRVESMQVKDRRHSSAL